MLNREALRKKKIEECDYKIEILHKKFPRLKEITEEISRLCYERIRVGVLQKNPTKAREIDQKVELLLKEKEFILKAHSLPLDIYEPEWNCPQCQDRGYITPGILCECYKQERLDAIFRQSGVKGEMTRQTFENFKVSFYKDPKVMEAKVARCKEFVKKLKNKEKQNNLFFTGDVGRGKTHLSVAIANAVLKQGNTVIYKRTDDLLDIIREYKFQRDSSSIENLNNQLQYLKEVDLLIIDDLGSENITPFAANQIRILIEDRNVLNKPWIINSNLGIDDLQDNYGERITDRIIEKADIFLFEAEMSIRELIKSKQLHNKTVNENY